MKIIKLAIFVSFVIIIAVACKNKPAEPSRPNDTITTDKPTEAPAPIVAKENYCFLSTLKKDSTFVNLTIEGDMVTGTMHWQPYEKDGATGTLTGKKNTNGEMELLYDYMIEGNQQTETKIMKIENGKLLIKTGELTDPKNDGHLVFKDATKLKYSETLNKVDCK